MSLPRHSAGALIIVGVRIMLTVHPPQDLTSLGPQCTLGTTEHISGCSQEINSFGLWVTALVLRVPPRALKCHQIFQFQFWNCRWPENLFCHIYILGATCKCWKNDLCTVPSRIFWFHDAVYFGFRNFAIPSTCVLSYSQKLNNGWRFWTCFYVNR